MFVQMYSFEMLHHFKRKFLQDQFTTNRFKKKKAQLINASAKNKVLLISLKIKWIGWLKTCLMELTVDSLAVYNYINYPIWKLVKLLVYNHSHNYILFEQASLNKSKCLGHNTSITWRHQELESVVFSVWMALHGLYPLAWRQPQKRLVDELFSTI